MGKNFLDYVDYARTYVGELSEHYKKRAEGGDIDQFLLDDERLVIGIANLLSKKYMRMRNYPGMTEKMKSSEHSDLLEKAVEKVKSYDNSSQASFVRAVEKATKRFQADTGVLKEDGILGERTLRSVLDAHVCNVPSASVRPAQGDDFRFFFEPVPDFPLLGEDPIDLFIEALDMWQIDDTFIPAQIVRSRSDANVIVSFPNLGGPGGVLGEATVGPPPKPGRGQHTIKFDKFENWTEIGSDAGTIGFKTVAAHEIGHALGISHLPAGTLMAPIYNQSIRSPLLPDLDQAIQIWGNN